MPWRTEWTKFGYAQNDEVSCSGLVICGLFGGADARDRVRLPDPSDSKGWDLKLKCCMRGGEEE